MKAKKDLHIWHRLKKKLIVSIVCVLGCLSVMAVGVYASTAQSFKTAVAGDIDIKISNVDGTIAVRRNGGIYTDYRTLSGGTGHPNYASWKTDEELYYNGLALKSADTGVFNKKAGEYVELYNYQDTNILENANYKRLIGEHLDVNYKNPTIEYIFKFDMNTFNRSGFSTKIALDYEELSGIKTATVTDENGQSKVVKQINVLYQYYFGESEPESWNGSDVSVFPKYTAGNVSSVVEVKVAETGESGGKSGNTIIIVNNSATNKSDKYVFIRCFAEYDTEHFGASYDYDSIWKFTLSFYGGDVE